MIEQDTLSTEMYNWLEKTKKHDLKPVSFKRLYNTIHFNILPYIGDLSVSDLTVQLINDKLINPLIDKGYSYSSIKKVKSALHSFYEYYLVKNELYMRPNIIDYIHIPTEQPTVVQYLTDKEAVRFINACKTENNVYSDLLLFLINTGVRVGEGIAVKGSDFNSHTQMITISKNATPVSSVNIRQQRVGVQQMTIQNFPKTKSGYRIIPVNDVVANLIKQRMNTYSIKDNDLIFASSADTLLWTYNIRRKCDRLMNLADIPKSKHGIHILRHTYATALFAEGIDLKTVSYLLGHSSIKVTADYYIHAAEAFQYEKGDRKFKPYPEYLKL